ncbi:hypothetical protein ACP26L_36570 (plasmid) [Paenibacillus sp. S-38]|uniref:hypothetical protein n=1 Tax=Paenibacillus sp. S-38 TaxID=3416710 RepID=UPI003CE9B36E
MSTIRFVIEPGVEHPWRVVETDAKLSLHDVTETFIIQSFKSYEEAIAYLIQLRESWVKEKIASISRK